MRCIAFGHLIRLSVWFLRERWNIHDEPQTKLKIVEEQINVLGNWSTIKEYLLQRIEAPEKQQWLALEDHGGYGGKSDEISF